MAIRKGIYLFLILAIIFSSAGCYRTVTINELTNDYTGLLGSKSLGDISLEKANKIRLSLCGITPNSSGTPTRSYFSDDIIFAAGGTSYYFSRGLTDNSSLSLNFGQTGSHGKANSGYTAGLAFKKGLRADSDGYYWMVARVGYDYLKESLNSFYVEEGFRVENIELHQGTLEIILSQQNGRFKPFFSQQLGLASFSYQGGQSGSIVPSFNELLMTAVGIEITWDDWGIILASKFKTSSSGPCYTGLGAYKNL
ncbi:MAG: hypothetical protein ABIH69_05150 [bacterium]|nr:hypothetical protein [Candidatus Margulisiibacteriota bacterium]